MTLGALQGKTRIKRFPYICHCLQLSSNSKHMMFSLSLDSQEGGRVRIRKLNNFTE